MGWNSANEIVDPQIRMLVKAVENDEMPEALAHNLLVELIVQCQSGDWDTESESLEAFLHVPWVVRAFNACEVEFGDGETYTKQDVKVIVRQVIDANVESFYDLSDDFARNVYAEKISEALAELLKLED